MSGQAQLRYDEKANGKTRFEVVGANGEVQMRSEWYDSKSNAVRGFKDLVASLNVIGEDDGA